MTGIPFSGAMKSPLLVRETFSYGHLDLTISDRLRKYAGPQA